VGEKNGVAEAVAKSFEGESWVEGGEGSAFRVRFEESGMVLGCRR
jgi:hypothetical protein